MPGEPALHTSKSTPTDMLSIAFQNIPQGHIAPYSCILMCNRSTISFPSVQRVESRMHVDSSVMSHRGIERRVMWPAINTYITPEG